ncbi:MAG: DNA repair protein RecO [Bacteroidales bacterium]|jgi:DNA repair protein RecO (recombination protein O)|nr:DNA repair protein RecO [Bacteroidales bacterium]
MQIVTEGIILRKIKYGENSSIVHIFTRQGGIRHFIVKGVQGGKKKQSAFFFPLTNLEFIMNATQDDKLGYIKDVRIVRTYKTIYQDIKKSTVVQFLAEVLSHVLANETQNTELFDFIKEKLQDFDNNESQPDFHILFLLDITAHLGFSPQKQKQQQKEAQKYFNLRDGCFCEEKPLHEDYFQGRKAELWDKLIHEKIVRERLTLLEAMLHYYRIHTGLPNIKSLQVLHEVFM